MLGKFVSVLVALLIAVFCVKFGAGVPADVQVATLSTLLNLSAVSFGVMGAWVAVVFPDILEGYGKAKAKAVADDARRVFNSLVRSILISTAVLVAIVGMHIGVPIAKQLIVSEEAKAIAKTLSFLAIGLLAYAQVVAIILTLIPLAYSDAKVNDAHHLSAQTSQHRKP